PTRAAYQSTSERALTRRLLVGMAIGVSIVALAALLIRDLGNRMPPNGAFASAVQAGPVTPPQPLIARAGSPLPTPPLATRENPVATPQRSVLIVFGPPGDVRKVTDVAATEHLTARPWLGYAIDHAIKENVIYCSFACKQQELKSFRQKLPRGELAKNIGPFP